MSEKIWEVGNDLSFLSDYSNGMFFQSFKNKVWMLEMRLYVRFRDKSIIYTCMYEGEIFKSVIYETLEMLCSIF